VAEVTQRDLCVVSYRRFGTTAAYTSQKDEDLIWTVAEALNQDGNLRSPCCGELTEVAQACCPVRRRCRDLAGSARRDAVCIAITNHSEHLNAS
jgi:hypothetical protein